ncbi:hypothetical protein ACU6WZ_09735 [Streptomyces hypolithicus]
MTPKPPLPRRTPRHTSARTATAPAAPAGQAGRAGRAGDAKIQEAMDARDALATALSRADVPTRTRSARSRPVPCGTRNWRP